MTLLATIPPDDLQRLFWIACAAVLFTIALWGHNAN